MKAFVVLFILISIYYYIFTRNHLVLTIRHIYFGTFVSIYLVIFYLVKYQKYLYLN